MHPGHTSPCHTPLRHTSSRRTPPRHTDAPTPTPVHVRPSRWRHARPAVILLALALLVAACSGQPSEVTWRNVTVPVPDGWYVFEESDAHLSLANAPLGAEDLFGERSEELDGDVVAMFFTYEPRTLPRDWLDYVEAQGARLESNISLWLDDERVPATQLVFSYETAGIPTREMVVLIPSRGIVVLSQPVPGPGDRDAPDVFLRHIETFLAVLENAEFGAPVMD